jgi:hypothetical protein
MPQLHGNVTCGGRNFVLPRLCDTAPSGGRQRLGLRSELRSSCQEHHTNDSMCGLPCCPCEELLGARHSCPSNALIVWQTREFEVGFAEMTVSEATVNSNQTAPT